MIAVIFFRKILQILEELRGKEILLKFVQTQLMIRIQGIKFAQFSEVSIQRQTRNESQKCIICQVENLYEK